VLLAGLRKVLCAVLALVAGNARRVPEVFIRFVLAEGTLGTVAFLRFIATIAVEATTLKEEASTASAARFALDRACNVFITPDSTDFALVRRLYVLVLTGFARCAHGCAGRTLVLPGWAHSTTASAFAIAARLLVTSFAMEIAVLAFRLARQILEHEVR
jgi:hypothetical protein